MPDLSVVDQLDQIRKEELLRAAQQEALKRCKTNGWFWATNFIQTRDDADSESPVKPLPDKPYLKEIWQTFDSHQRIAVVKSRQLMLSWLVCAYCVWTARFKENRSIYFLSKKAEDAHDMVCLPSVEEGGYAARMQFIIRSMPPWMRGKWTEKEGELGCIDTSSIIRGLASGADQVRGKTPSLLVLDEMAYQPEAGGVYQAVAPLLQKATTMIAISTPNGPSNIFATLVHGGPLLTNAPV